MSRLDARAKATGTARYVADLELPGMVHAAAVRSTRPHARILAVDLSDALAQPGVLGVFTAADVAAGTYGRGVRDVPILAREKVRFVGEPIAAVVAETRPAAESAAALVVVDYEDLPAVTTPEQALLEASSLVHDEAWSYPRAFIKPEHGRNLQSWVRVGSAEGVEEALRSSAAVVDQVYRTPAGHQGYLEPQACVADRGSDGRVRVWLTNKSPYRLRAQLAECLGIEPDLIEVQPTFLGGDFGGKGSPEEAPLCVELSRLVGRPVKLVLRYAEDLTATNPRHPSRIRVRLGADAEGRFRALALDVLLDGGAYAGFKPSPDATIHGVLEAPAYRIAAFFAECRVAYTNTVPKGHMRAPGAPQATFAIESAVDELAISLGIDPAELRRRNLLRSGERDANGHSWAEVRAEETLDAALAALAALEPRPAPAGWLVGRGMSLYARGTATGTSTSLRIVPVDDGGLRIEVAVPETGTGSHTVMRQLIAGGLALAPERVEVVQVSTDDLPQDVGAGGSRVTASMAIAADAAVKAWLGRLSDEPMTVVVDEPATTAVGSYSVQIAQVAVDPETGQCRVLEILSAIDVADIINPKAHQMQIDGGTTMGFGFACLEDLDELDGQVWAANLGEFKLPSARDVPAYRTVLVRGGRGVGTANVKNIGESTNPPTAAAIANAVAAATGARVRELPLLAERIYRALGEGVGGR